MTREDAIECLKRADITVGKEIKTKTAQALEMAIMSLEQEPILDKIRAEIMSKDGLEEALEIIDKYIESEDKI